MSAMLGVSEARNAKMSKLGDVVQGIEQTDNALTIYAVKPWSADSDALLAVEPDQGAPEVPKGMEYCLEASLVKEVIEVWSEWREGAVPTAADRMEAVLYYAEYDAYLPTAEMLA
ncbi:MAG: hypothetical protein QOF10_4619 [Kribbellaceae bacterium]|jgi:hypothetical protein|nr:hypothetical protein [Kribbellaceae bacterium]